MLRGWKGFILCLLCLYFSRSPALDSFGVTLPIALFLLALCLFSAHPYNLVRKQGQRAWGGEREERLFFSLFISLCMTYSASFNINSGDSEIWMLRIQTDADIFGARLVSTCFEMLNTLRNIAFSRAYLHQMNGRPFEHPRVSQKERPLLYVWTVASLFSKL